MTVSPPKPMRLPSLTGLRCVLAILVFLCHALETARLYADDRLNHLGVILPYGISSLSCFFILSGFALTWSAAPGDTPALFWRRRVVKIFPNHILTWALTLALLGIVFGPLPMLGPPPDAGPALANLALVQTWIPVPSYLLSVNGISWSVSCELFFYLLFPLLIGPLRRIAANRLWWCFGATAAAIALLPALIDAAISAPAWPLWPPFSFTETWLVYFFPVVRMPEFLLGVLLALIVQADRWPPVRMSWVAGATVLFWLITLALPPIYGRSGFLAIPLALLIPVLATRDLRGETGWLQNRTVVALGEASYAMYLLHYPVMAVTRHLLGPDRYFGVVEGTLVIVAMFVICQLLAIALFRCVEDPLVRRFSRPARGRAPRGPEQAEGPPRG
ncbi:acyltransferase family protein [Nocardiopsis ansamitocini]|uniref:Acyltransferase n=1 Tax=Nocardiopsis ansamitocini TaxID=1670832 RepID=A0A9W6UIW6_9ACTN|nr:acyltransferase [Nocardiopsis ansamitocini]GLU50341.1 acyltransferase [Nocardiopsis ansamitocini]